ncbi:serine hydrolase domain-containing protein [Maribacter sp. HTCC2170]|uniref:serine hydrolase domain-containing protein n=1 Tax=Maribacter sp. (strain HTCC2170 / KCCM 42371) TaxID=313603 RepID=UPI00006AFC91|nr:serine hydrolase domain-containing protein [Maribacter sp. HTCC2170]EAR01264.1 alkaline D-peptidase and alkaline D-peptidase fusion [Maribacter sp. HTCC2170]
MTELEKTLQTILDKKVDCKKVFGTSFAVKKGSFVWHGTSGNLSKNQPYFIASTTKLFSTAIILKLKAENVLKLDDKISNYIDKSILSTLHIYEGKEYSERILIKHLLAHTSGLPDYFQDKGANGKSLEDELLNGNDQSWNFEQVIERAKKIPTLFAPGTKNKAHYSDTNFQLLGRIIENITDKSFYQNCNDLIINPLNLTKTYLYQDPIDSKPKTLYYRKNELNIPKAMTSFGPDGGIVSTSEDMLVFIEAFFTGKLFPSSFIDELKEWNKIFYPMRSGIGLHLFKLPWIFNPTGVVPSFIGYSGLSGALAYYSPKENIYIAGTVNQVAHPDISFKTMIKLTQKLKNK